AHALRKERWLQPDDMAILLWIADHYNDEAGCAWPAQERLAALVGMSDRHLRRKLNDLRDRGVLDWQKVDGRRTEYRFGPWADKYGLQRAGQKDTGQQMSGQDGNVVRMRK